SVTITVATLKELGRLNTRVGTSIISAAILDDIIGLVILSIFIGLENPNAVSPWMTILNTILFFLFAIAAGIVFHFIYKFLEHKYPQSRRMIIFGLALCFFYSYAAEKWFGLADITGAFCAGIILSNLKTSSFIVHRVDVTAYMIFGPVFFASIGIKTSLQGMDSSMLLFGFLFVIIGLLTKVIGCGLGAKFCHFTTRESLMVGIGMVARAEVMLITAQKGIDVGIFNPKFMPYVIALVVVSSLLTPVLLKFAYKSDPPPPNHLYA
ncbi:MAG: cation:proton antiporter, partial [Clostridia bacterium]